MHAKVGESAGIPREDRICSRAPGGGAQSETGIPLGMTCFGSSRYVDRMLLATPSPMATGTTPARKATC
ncbi:MAG: hypothetical protein A2V77_18415 [Anaeromyxobacter sp. RBG_16_69_14]|nr:MAG: hypothetical protein A2V77_18415 [Anaeromyxobacter sp. RBG_16_69_14]